MSGSFKNQGTNPMIPNAPAAPAMGAVMPQQMPAPPGLAPSPATQQMASGGFDPIGAYPGAGDPMQGNPLHQRMAMGGQALSGMAGPNPWQQ